MLTPTPKLPVACYAQPLTDAKLSTYKSTIAALPVGPVKDALQACYDCVATWWKLPESKKEAKEKWRAPGVPGFDIIPLEDDHIAKLDPVTPWGYELDAMQALFDALPSGTEEVPATPEKPARSRVVDQTAFELKRIAFDLIVHAQQITRDWEPVTTDKLIRS